MSGSAAGVAAGTEAASATAAATASTHQSGLLTGVVLAAVSALAVAGLFAWAVKQLLAPSLTRAGTGLAAWLADHLAVLRSSSLRRIRRYQRSAAGYAREHTLGFGTEPVNVRDVYVPLHREAAEGGDREDLYELIRGSRRTVVTGEAGAGKSMLLKHSLMKWTEGRATRRSVVPVVVELRRLNALDAAGIDLTEQVIAFLETHRFRGAAGFARKALQDGRLSVLFDGLDEVTSDRLDRVVDLLRDFAQRYDGCQVVVTCRASLYRGELDFGAVVRVAELDDATIRRLLARWPGLDDAAQERLYLALGTNGTLKRLARSPLMLSMMAWLTAARITLPASRAEFYDTAIEHLVKRDDVLKRGRSQFPASKKLAVLRGLALLLQDRAGGDGDRLSIAHDEALAYIRSVATAIDLDDKDGEELLRELAERTELLVATGGVAPRYSFRHLTFQEYLAAVELRDDREGLLERYDRDPNAWRETVILWCGKADRDTVPLIKELMKRGSVGEQVLALECAAAATKVDEATVTAVVDLLIPSLSAVSRSVRAQVSVAFGNAMAGSGPRSARIRGRLMEMARAAGASAGGKKTVSRGALVKALALSGHGSVAEFLAGLAATDASARSALRSMGDLAIPSLADRAAEGHADALDDIVAIGTPAALGAVIGRLEDSGSTARRAAWHLGCLLSDSAFAVAVEARGRPVRKAKGREWIWQPFSLDEAMIATVALIAEHIEESLVAEHLGESEPDDIPDRLGALDFRLVLALSLGTDVPATWSRGRGRALIESLALVAAVDWEPEPAVAADFRNFMFEEVGWSQRQRRMVDSLSWSDQARLMNALAGGAQRSQWKRATFGKGGRWARSARWRRSRSLR
ncbi:NACHT domain-containing protein [Catenulispora sp. NF23]|uniref:NACHT domain-containing protein n=1 Tax=Catenulispora pinistramenti TaxID=2705254 RepID=UPI001BADFF40|nr:NACHT domain-containing protein [Catenulispora pinistramenti]MBS2535441.1 NACHT domain-containing protein [Catenulispora pinistramenti]